VKSIRRQLVLRFCPNSTYSSTNGSQISNFYGSAIALSSDKGISRGNLVFPVLLFTTIMFNGWSRCSNILCADDITICGTHSAVLLTPKRCLSTKEKLRNFDINIAKYALITNYEIVQGKFTSAARDIRHNTQYQLLSARHGGGIDD
jgi:hypothetical protein